MKQASTGSFDVLLTVEISKVLYYLFPIGRKSYQPQIDSSVVAFDEYNQRINEFFPIYFVEPLG